MSHRISSFLLFINIVLCSTPLALSQNANIDSVAIARIRTYLTSLYNVQISSADFVINHSVVQDMNPYMSTKDCGNLRALYFAQICENCGNGELKIGHLTKTNLYCIYSSKSKMCCNILSVDEFNAVALRISNKFSISELGMLYLTISEKYKSYNIIDNWSATNIQDSLLINPFFEDKVMQNLAGNRIRPILSKHGLNKVTFFVGQWDELRKVTFYFSRNKRILRLKEGPVNNK